MESANYTNYQVVISVTPVIDKYEPNHGKLCCGTVLVHASHCPGLFVFSRELILHKNHNQYSKS